MTLCNPRSGCYRNAGSRDEASREQLELANTDAYGGSNINQLLLIPCVILDFLCIHPFSYGNRLMSRLLSLLLLYKNGYDVGNMCFLRNRSTTTRRSITKRYCSLLLDGI